MDKQRNGGDRQRSEGGNFSWFEIEATSRVLRSLVSVIRLGTQRYTTARDVSTVSIPRAQQRALDIPPRAKGVLPRVFPRNPSIGKVSEPGDPPCRRIGNRL